MAKTIPASGAGAVRIMLKNKDVLTFDLREKNEEQNIIEYSYDIFYENVTGILHIRVQDNEVVSAAMQLSMGKVITLENDTNLKKLCHYVLEA